MMLVIIEKCGSGKGTAKVLKITTCTIELIERGEKENGGNFLLDYKNNPHM